MILLFLGVTDRPPDAKMTYYAFNEVGAKMWPMGKLQGEKPVLI